MNRVSLPVRLAIRSGALAALLAGALPSPGAESAAEAFGRPVIAPARPSDRPPSHLGWTDPFDTSHSATRAAATERNATETDRSTVATRTGQAPQESTTASDDVPVSEIMPVSGDGVTAPPVPPANRIPQPPPPEPVAAPSASAPGQALSEMAPWNPAPPCGVTLTDPGGKYPSVKVTGFFQADAVWFDQDDANKAQVGDVPDGADFRRARLAATGDAWENVGYMIEMDFAAPGRPSFMDVYADFRDMLAIPATVRVGQWRMPFGMTSMTSVRELEFLERPLPFAFVPFRQIGIGLFDSVADDNLTWAVSGFRYPTDVYGGNVGDSGGYSLATRETIVLGGESDDDPLLHLGGDYSYLNSSFDTFRVLNQPEVFVNEVPGPVVPVGAFLNVPAFVDTGLLNAEQANLFGAELGGRAGSFWMQAELYSMVIDRASRANPTFWGAYSQVGYILTGEVRPYSRANGVFTRIKPNSPVKKGGGLGAWEIAGRWSVIDVNDAGIDGGKLTDLTAGLNWYLNDRTKFQFNYIHAYLDRRPTGDSNANILAARAQIDF